METISSEFRAGYVAIIGLPNAGKSTLMNSLLDIKLSIISSKPQTTRRRVLGILNKKDLQAIFIDTPGILEPKYNLQKRMMQNVGSALDDADLILMIVDAKQKTHPVRLDINSLNPKQKPVVLILNKVDIIPKADLLPLIEKYSKHYPFQSIIPISALKKDGMAELEKEMSSLLPLSPPYYPPDTLTDRPERFFVAEIIREKIFEKFWQEIPYSTEVEIETFTERDKGKDYISAVIYVERKSQKGILIGNKGEALKSIGSEARAEIETFLDRGVFLDLRVKVNEDWRKDDKKLNRLGY
ncbi:MAG: GTPase Era [Calditrichaceae bacterium]